MNDAAILHPKNAMQHRFHLLDAMRGVAALLVVLFHLPTHQGRHPLESEYLAVDFFFCLSGFVIAHSYEERLRKDFRLRDFVAARLIRLYPMFFLGTIAGMAFLVLVRFQLPLNPVFARWFFGVTGMELLMLPNRATLPNMYMLDPPAWSLFCELIANLVYATLIRFGLGSTWMMALLALVSGAAMLHWHQLVYPLFAGSARWDMTLARLTISFVLGVCVSRAYRRIRQRRSHHFWSGIVQALCSLTLVVLLIMTPSPWLSNSIVRMLSLMVLFPLLVYMGAGIGVPQVWTRLGAWLGNVSYPLYLLHLPVIQFVSSTRILKRLQASSATVALGETATVAIAVVIASLAFHFYDAPVRRRLTAVRNRWIVARLPSHTQGARNV